MPTPIANTYPVKTSAPSRGGFSLVLSLTVMAMLLLLCLGAATLLSVELRVAQTGAAMAKARLNALVAARIALGEIQRTLGPDQRVSATADLLCSSDPTDPTTRPITATPITEPSSTRDGSASGTPARQTMAPSPARHPGKEPAFSKGQPTGT